MGGLLDLASKWSNIYSALKLGEIRDEQKEINERERNRKEQEDWDRDPLNQSLKDQAKRSEAEENALKGIVGLLLDIKNEINNNPELSRKMMATLVNETWKSDESALIMSLDRIIRQEFSDLKSLFIECFANEIFPIGNIDLDLANKEIQKYEKLIQTQLDTFLGLITNSISSWKFFKSDVKNWPEDFDEQINKSLESLCPPPQIYSELIFNLKNDHLLKEYPSIISIFDNELERLKTQLLKAKNKFQKFRKIQTEKENELKRIIEKDKQDQDEKSREIVEISDELQAHFRSYEDKKLWRPILGFIFGALIWHIFLFIVVLRAADQKLSDWNVISHLAGLLMSFVFGGEIIGLIFGFLIYKIIPEFDWEKEEEKIKDKIAKQKIS